MIFSIRAGSSLEKKPLAEDSPQNTYLKKYIERITCTNKNPQHFPEDQGLHEESFRLNRNTIDNPDPFTRKPQKRKTFSERSQQIIKEKLDALRNPKKDESLFTLIREFWDKGNKGVPFEERKKLLFKTESIQDFKINSGPLVLEHVRINNKVRQRPLRINDHAKSEILWLNTEAASSQSTQKTWMNLEKKVTTLCRSEYMSSKEPMYDAAEKSERDNRELWKNEHSPNDLKALRGCDNAKSERQKFSIFRRLATSKTKILPTIKLSEKSQDDLQKILGDSACTLNDESLKSSLKDTNSTMNTISSPLDSPLCSRNLLVKECLTPQHKKSQFNLPRTLSLKSEICPKSPQKFKNDLSVVTDKTSPKRTSKVIKTDIFNWKTADDEVAALAKADERDRIKALSSLRSRRQITLPPLNQTEMRESEGDRSLVKIRELSQVTNHKDNTQASQLVRVN